MHAEQIPATNKRGQFLDIDCSCRFLYASVDFPVAAIGVDGSISEGRSKVRDGATFFVLSNSRRTTKACGHLSFFLGEVGFDTLWTLGPMRNRGAAHFLGSEGHASLPGTAA